MIEEQNDVLSPEELRGLLDGFSDADWIKLGKIADALCLGVAVEGKDVLHEVIGRALAGTRRCPRDVAPLVFLVNAMRSYIDALLKTRDRDVLAQSVTIDPDEERSELILARQQDIATPEEILIANQTITGIENAFQDDEMAQMVVMGQVDDLTPQEIQAVTGLTPVQYASVLRLIRRRLDKLNLGGNA